MFPDKEFRPIDVRYMDWFETQKTDTSLATEGIQISTPIDIRGFCANFLTN